MTDQDSESVAGRGGGDRRGRRSESERMRRGKCRREMILHTVPEYETVTTPESI